MRTHDLCFVLKKEQKSMRTFFRSEVLEAHENQVEKPIETFCLGGAATDDGYEDRSFLRQNTCIPQNAREIV